jgi:hypothetical protein
VSLGFSLLTSQIPRAQASLQRQDQGSGEALSEHVARQIQALLDEKESRTPVQQKIDSQLLYTMKMHRGLAIAAGVETLNTDVVYDQDDGKTIVDISGRVTNGLLRRLRANGAEILYSDARYGSIRASISLTRLERIAALDGVTFIQPKQEALAGRPKPQEVAQRTVSDAPPGFSERAARVRASISEMLERRDAAEFGLQSVGSVSSQGDVTHKANTARSTFGVNGTGVKIGVLSNGVVNLAASQARGDLGPVTVLPGQTGTGDEGTAMLEIIHDLAPGAQLFFATAFTSITSFAQNIRDLRTAGCDIIVDDVFYFAESKFQDGAPGPTNTNGGVVTQAVNDVTAAGAMYFSSAGNEGNKNDNTAGVWEGDFLNGGASAAPLPLTGNVHNFGGQNFNVITVSGGNAISLFWSDPLGGSANDYDLFILNSTGTTLLASSTNIQNGTQDPFEITGTGANLRVVVLKKTGAADRFLHVNAIRGRFSISTIGQTHGHSAAAEAFSCAATPAANFAAPPNPVGPFPNPHNSTNTVELFSSDGPRKLFFQPNGTPYTPGNVSSTGGIVRQKPDITAADGVSVTGVGGFPSPFFGTSASAPHAAAIAGLLKSAVPSFTNAQIRTALTTSAIDIEAAGVDRDSGAGIIMALEAGNALGIAAAANVDLGTVTAQENPGNGDGFFQPGEGVKLTIQLTNNGSLPATGVNATLTTATPGITVTLPGTSSYPDLPATSGAAVNNTPFTFTILPSFVCGARIEFTLNVTYTGGPSPKQFNFGINTAEPTVITSTLDATAPVAGTGFTTATGMQTGRVTRANPPGACGATKAFPGVTDPANARRFDAYTFTTCASSAPSCVTVTLTNACTGNRQMFDVMYLNSFDPANIGTNYRTDAAASNIVGGPISFSATLAGGTTFVIVVSDVNLAANSAVGCNYTLQVSGACFVCAPTNQPPTAVCQNVTVPAGASCTADASINNGSSDPEGGPLTITQSPAGPYPLGTTSVLLTVVDDKGATSQCTANVTVVDTTPPSITCPSNVTGVAAVTCPVSTTTSISYPTPTASDNCPGLGAVICTPPSGGAFPAGTTTVTCTVADSSGNTATCSFSVVVFNICLQDDSNPAIRLLIDTVTKKYVFFCGATTYTGTGTIAQSGCTFTLDHNAFDRRIRATFSTSTKIGNASAQSPPGTLRCSITDRNMGNNTCNAAP